MFLWHLASTTRQPRVPVPSYHEQEPGFAGMRAELQMQRGDGPVSLTTVQPSLMVMAVHSLLSKGAGMLSQGWEGVMTEKDGIIFPHRMLLCLCCPSMTRSHTFKDKRGGNTGGI